MHMCSIENFLDMIHTTLTFKVDENSKRCDYYIVFAFLINDRKKYTNIDIIIDSSSSILIKHYLRLVICSLCIIDMKTVALVISRFANEVVIC